MVPLQRTDIEDGEHTSPAKVHGDGDRDFFSPSADGNRYLISDGEISRSTTTAVGVSTTVREGVYEIHIIGSGMLL